MAENHETCDVVILGAGLAGMTAAYELRDRHVVVLERRDRVGGRTYSAGDDSAWVNLGAQVVATDRVIALTRELGLDLVSAKSADFGFIVDGKYARGSSRERLFLNLNLPWRRKLDFGITTLRLQRKLRAVAGMTPQQRAELDGESLLELIGRVSPTTLRLLSECCESAVGIPASEASALFGLVYALSTFLDPATKERMYGVRGGTQRISLAIAERLNRDSIRTGAQVESVRQIDERVVVRYRHRQGASRSLVADQCICALPARDVLEVVDDLPPDQAAACRRLTPYASLITVAWPVADRQPAPWDGAFFWMVSGSEGFNHLTNYGYLTKQTRPELGGYINTVAAGAKATLFEAVDDEALVDRQYEELTAIFPQARRLIDRAGAMVQRWERCGLPPMRPGYLADRAILRRSLGNIHFCGDYTSEPGLSGANGSGYHAARQASKLLTAVGPAAA